MPPSAIFQLYHGGHWRKPSNLPQVTDKLVRLDYAFM